jgi:plastocyanin
MGRSHMHVRDALMAVAMIVAAPAVHAGVIRGTVRVPSLGQGGAPAPDPYAGRASAMPMARSVPHGSVTDAVVFVESVSPAVDSALAASAPRPRLAQKDQSFVPRVLPIAVGTTVDFPNLDPIYHNVFSPSPLKRFDLGKYPRGQSKSVTFGRPGVVNVYCDIHSDMEAFVLVLPHHAFTQPSASGAFELPSLPPGSYVLRAWHPDFHELRREVEVPANGDVSVDLSF